MVKNFLFKGKQLVSRKQSSILSAAAVITMASFLSAALGFVRERILVGYFFETTELQQQLDAFRVASRLPELAFQLLVIGSLSAAFIPVFSRYLKKSEKEAYEISSSIINLVLLAFLVISVIVLIFADKLTGLITSVNFTADQVELAANLTRVMLIAQFFFALSNFLTGMIQSQHRFLIPALSPLAHNIGIIAGIVLFAPYLGIYSAAVGVVLGAFLHLLFQVPLARSLGFKYSASIRMKHPGVREMIKLMPPRTLAISIGQIEVLATGFFATAMSAGTLTIFELSHRLMSAPVRVFSVPIGQASLPFLSQENSNESRAEFKKLFLSSLLKILYLAMPASAILLVLRIPLVRILYGAREFPWSATLLTGRVVAILALSIFAQSANHILNRAFYALENTKIPLLAALFSVVTNVTLASIFTFVYHYGVLGLGVAMSISSILNAIVLFVLLQRTVGGFSKDEFFTPFFKMILATMFTGVFLWAPLRLLDRFVFDTTRTVPLIALTVTASLIGFLVYVLSSIVLKIDEIKAFGSLIRRMGNWKKALNKTEEVLEPTSQSQEIRPM